MTFKNLAKISAYSFFIIIAALGIAAAYFRPLDNFELNTFDMRFRLRPAAKPSDKVVIIEIGEDSVNKLGQFPFNRQYHAILIKALSEFGARTVVFDILFSEPKDHDEDLEAAVKEAGNVYLASAFEVDSIQRSNFITAGGYAAKCKDALASAAAGVGHINIIPDPDGKFRRIPPYIKYRDGFYPHLSVLAAFGSMGAKKEDIKIPVDERSEMMINYSGRWGERFAHYSFCDVLQTYLASATGQKPILDPKFFKDKVCVVGLTTLGADIHPSPYEALFPGVGIHAETISSIFNKNFIRRASRGANLAILIILAFAVSVITSRVKPLHGLAALVLLIFLLILTAVLLFDLAGLWIDIVAPVLIMVVAYLAFTLRKLISEWKKRLVVENELGIARKIQESFLPKKLPEAKGLSVAAAMFTAKQVGGDLYDFVEFDDGRTGIMIGDVSGKGVPASLFMAMVVGAFRSFAIPGAACNETLANLNAKLVKESGSNLFVTVFYAIFDLKKKTLDYANGGHLALLRLETGKGPEFLDVEEGAPLGLMDGPYSAKKINLKEGDIYVFYTDGVTEAMDAKKNMYEKERLAAVVKSNRDLPAKALVEAIEKDVRRFEPQPTQHDDITMIVVKVGQNLD